MSGILGQPAHVGPLAMSKFLNNNFVPLNWNGSFWKPSYTHKLSAGESFLIKEYGLRLKGNDIDYKLNSFGFRCDEFQKKNEEIDHTLFAGCSFTFGESLPYMLNWSGITFSKLSQKENTSKYYSLSYTGGSIDYIVENIYRYIQFSGKPSKIFVLFPESKRRMSLHLDEPIVLNPDTSQKSHMDYVWGSLNSIDYQVDKIKKFEKYCIDNDIYMIWTSWSDSERKIYQRKNFSSYVNFEPYDIKNKMTNKNSFSREHHKYYDIARDERHPGIGYNSAISNIFMERYVSDNTE